MTHTMTVERGQFGGFRLVCSCDPDGYVSFSDGPVAYLADLNESAHQHIEASESDPGYGTKSAVTSEDELVDLETGLRRNGTW